MRVPDPTKDLDGATSGETRYMVIRGTGDERLDGKWFDREQTEGGYPKSDPGAIKLFSTGALEYREDGTFAEVYRPKGSFARRGSSDLQEALAAVGEAALPLRGMVEASMWREDRPDWHAKMQRFVDTVEMYLHEAVRAVDEGSLR